MKTVTADFRAAQARPDATFVRSVWYKRRKWDTATTNYIWETSWTRLALDEVVTISPVTWKLDSEQLNEFKVSNVTVVVQNFNNKWRPDNPGGIFGKDSGSTDYFYDPYFMKFQIRAGFQLAGGTTEEINVFTGLATDYQMDSQSRDCQILIAGLESQLLNTKAEGIGTSVSLENVGTGNGVTTAFTTANPGVGGITQVTVNGVAKIEGSDFSVSQLNDASLGAKVTFTAAVTNTHIVRVSYFYWPQNKQFHEIVTLLLNAGGIAGASQSVQPVLFDNSVLNTFTKTTQADFDAGTKTRIASYGTNTNFDPGYLWSGYIGIDFDNASNKEAQTWAAALTGWTTYSSGTPTVTSDGTYLIFNTGASGGNCSAWRSSDRRVGGFEFKFTFGQTSNSSLTVTPCASSVGATGNPTKTGGYGITITDSVIQISGSITAAIAPGTTEHTVKVLVDQTGTRVYYDGVLTLTGTQRPATSSYWVVNWPTTGGTGKICKLRGFSTPVATATGDWISATVDFGAAPTAWGAFDYTEQLNSGGTSAYYTRTSTDGVTFDSYVAVSAGFPQSALKRYAQIKVSLSMVTNTTIALADVAKCEPAVDEVVLRGTTGSTLVTVPNVAGLSVYEAIQKIGEFTNYEFGFSPDEVFFFRSKTPAAAAMTLTGSDYISRISGFSSGFDRVYSVVRAVYGLYTREVTDAGGTSTSPAERVNTKRYEISPDSNIAVAVTADIATGVATGLAAFLAYPRRRARVLTKFLPQLDLSDVVAISLLDNQPTPAWYWGDDFVYWGEPSIYYWGKKQQLAYGLNMKIIGARYDLERQTCELELEEVL
jgi:hypothetical protein